MMQQKYCFYDTESGTIGYVDTEDEAEVQAAAEELLEYIYFVREPLTIEDFLIERVIDLEKLSAWWKNSISDPNPWLDLTQCIRMAIDWHKNWPVLVETPPKMEQSFTDPDYMRVSMIQHINFLTQEEYRKKFGSEPPAAPLLRMWASQFAWHPDFNEEWRS